MPILCCIVMLLWKKYRMPGMAAGISLALEALLTNVIIKNVVARPRPYTVIDGLTHVSWIVPSDYAFPSGHTGACFAVGIIMLVMLPKKAGVTAFILAVLAGISRLYLGVHYPTDVLGGAVIGIITAVIGYFIVTKGIQPKLEAKK